MISKRRWGLPSDIEEQEVMIKKSVDDLNCATPYQKNILAYSHKVYRIGAILPEYLYDNSDFYRILKSEMKSINQLAHFYDGSLNETIARKAFSGLLIDQLRQTVNEKGQDNY